MKLNQSKDKFINLWGTLGNEWGINRTMAQVHAALLMSEDVLSTDEVMELLNISRGNANMNLRELVNWGLVYREIKAGQRKDYFRAEKDIWQVAQKIAAERKKRELDPMMRCIEEILEEEEVGQDKEFKKLLKEIHGLGQKSNYLLKLVSKFNQSDFFKPLMKLLK